MKIELKNVKVAEFASEETTCFQASIYIDGKKEATVSNAGRGGCNIYRFTDRKVEDKFKEFCNSQPPIQGEYAGGEKYTLDMNPDLYIGELLGNYELHKRCKTLCKKKTLFRLKEDDDTVARAVNMPFSPDVKQYLIARYGDRLKVIINETI